MIIPELNSIVKCKFHYGNENVISSIFGTNDSIEVINIDVDIYQLLTIMNVVEQKRGIGSSIHSEVITGVDYLGKQVKFDSYLLFDDNYKCYKYNFDENIIPLNPNPNLIMSVNELLSEIIRQKRNDNIDELFNSFNSKPKPKPTRVVHFKKEEYDIYIGRLPAGKFNKWAYPKVLRDSFPKGTPRKVIIDAYESYLLSNKELMNDLHELCGKVLGCWCRPDRTCHGDILKKYVDKL